MNAPARAVALAPRYPSQGQRMLRDRGDKVIVLGSVLGIATSYAAQLCRGARPMTRYALALRMRDELGIPLGAWELDAGDDAGSTPRVLDDDGDAPILQLGGHER